MTRKFAIPVLFAALLVSVSTGLWAQPKTAPKAKGPAAAALDPSAVLKSMKFRSIGPTHSRTACIPSTPPRRRLGRRCG